MKVLLHTCCGPCLNGTLRAFDRDTLEITSYWYNPNIHPYKEYESRLNALKDYTKDIKMELIVEDNYGLKQFVKMVADDLDNRCSKCYKERLIQTAKKAKELGFDAFSSTLLVSPYQQHETIKQMAEDIAKEFGVSFYYVDPRPYFREGNQNAREIGLYMQKYCGCVFSEEERYLKNSKKLS